MVMEANATSDEEGELEEEVTLLELVVPPHAARTNAAKVTPTPLT